LIKYLSSRFEYTEQPQGTKQVTAGLAGHVLLLALQPQFPSPARVPLQGWINNPVCLPGWPAIAHSACEAIEPLRLPLLGLLALLLLLLLRQRLCCALQSADDDATNTPMNVLF